MTEVPTSAERTITAEVEVRVDPATAFSAFTDELDLWWVRGPINHWAAGKAAAMRCEPGVGGRLLEVYDDATGDVLELARITAWEPPQRLAWHSSLDDVNTEVSFEASGSSTTVRVVARIPAGGADHGGSTWTRAVPDWFGAWCERREDAPRHVVDLARLALGVYYERPAAAARWLAEVFGFTSPTPLPAGEDPLAHTDHGHPWIEFRIANSSLMVFPRDAGPPATVTTYVPWVYVDDLEAHAERATACGATIVRPPDAGWGLATYVAKDLEGNEWTFAQARPTM